MNSRIYRATFALVLCPVACLAQQTALWTNPTGGAFEVPSIHAATAAAADDSTWTITVTGNLTIAAKGLLCGNGIVNGNVINEGAISPGAPLGAIEINGNYSQARSGSLMIELGGLIPNQYDKLTVAGNALLDGTLDVTLTNDFMPVLGNTFTILSTIFGNRSGVFAVEDLPNLAGGLAFDVVYNPQAVELVVIEAPVLAGDYNLDGAVDDADYVVWRHGLGGAFTPEDYRVWRQNFGRTVGSSMAAGAQQVPEPAGVPLFVLSLWLLWKSRRPAMSRCRGRVRPPA